MNRETRLRIADKMDKAIYVVLLILALAVCVSEPLSRNAIRLLWILFFGRIIMSPPSQEEMHRYKAFAVICIGFVLILMISALYGGEFYEEIRDYVFVFNTYSLLLPFIVLVGISRKTQLDWIIRCILISIVVVDFYIFWQVAHGIKRPISFIKAAPMVTAMMYVIILPMLFNILTQWRDMSLLKRILYSIGSALTLIAFILNGTRGAWLSLLGILPLLLLFYRVPWKKIAVSAGVGGLLIAAVCIMVPNSMQRIQSITDMQDESKVERVRIWHSAINMGMDHPVLGVGLGNYEEQYQTHYIAADAQEPFINHAHNNFLQFFGEDGLVGLLGYCMLFGYCLFWAWKKRKNPYARMLLLSTMALQLYGLTDYTYAGWAAMRLYWLFVGVCLCGMDLEKSTQASD